MISIGYVHVCAAFLLLSSVTSCAARQTSAVNPGAGHTRAVCTPHIPKTPVRGTLVTRTVCEVPPQLRAIGRTTSSARSAASGPSGRHTAVLLGYPGASAPDEDRVTSAVDEIAEALAEPNPIAGIGDPRRAWQILAALPMQELLFAFDVLAQRGLLGELMHYRDGAGPRAARVEAALALWPLVGKDATMVSPEQLERAALGLDAMDPDDYDEALHYLLARRQLSREIEVLVEGLLTLERSTVKWLPPVRVAGSPAGLPPAPVEPRPWPKRLGQPRWLYLGNDAHAQIARHYRLAHPTDDIVTNSTPISSVLDRLKAMGHEPESLALTASERRKRPDIVNLSELHIYEIKPSNAIAVGAAQARMYLGIMHGAGIAMSLGPSWAPGTSGQLSAPGGVYLFWSPEPGVIAYEYRTVRLVPTPVVQSDDEESTLWSWELEPIPAPTSTWVWVLTTAAAMAAALILAPASS